VIQRYRVPLCVASFEARPKPHIRRQLRALLIGKLERDATDDERKQADAWIEAGISSC
jgi:twinkle protein